MSISLKDASKKLLDIYIQSFTRIQTQSAFEKCLELLHEVNGSIELGAGVQLTRSAESGFVVVLNNQSREESTNELFVALRDCIERGEMNIGVEKGHVAIELNYNESKIARLEAELREKKDQLHEISSKAQNVIKSLLDSPKHRRSTRISSLEQNQLKSTTFFSVPEEEEVVLHSTTRLKDTYNEHEKMKMEAIRGHFKATPSVISIGELMGEEERAKTPDPTVPSLKSSIIPSPRENTIQPVNFNFPARERGDLRKDSLLINAAKNALIGGVQTKISQMIKYTIHVSSLSVIIALSIFCLSSIITRIDLNHSDMTKIEIIDQAICADVDPARFMKDIEYVQGPSLTALSVVALVISITNYGLRIALENLTGKYSSKWLWIFPLVACVLEMVAVLLMFKGKNAFADLQTNLFKMISINCVKNPESAVEVFNQLFGIYGQQFMFTVVGAMLSIYQLIFYLSNVFVIESMQSLK